MPETETIKHHLLSVSDLHAYYGESHVLQGVSLMVGEECVAVLGRNGMGKTTLLRSIMGLTPPRSGAIEWNSREISGLKPFDIASMGLGYVPQGRRLFPSLSVEEHLTLTYRKGKNGSNYWTPKKVFEMFPELAERRKLSGARLSGGEQQMLAIGRALVTNPELILLDEPSEGLSPVAVDRVIEICRELLKSNIAILLVEQNIHVAEALAERVYILLSGKTVFEFGRSGIPGKPGAAPKIFGRIGGILMAKTICIIGALDTKGLEFAFLKAEIEKRGCKTLTVNVGVLEEPLYQPQVSAAEVADAGGTSLADLIAQRDRGEAMSVMVRGAAAVVKKLYEAGQDRWDHLDGRRRGHGDGHQRDARTARRFSKADGNHGCIRRYKRLRRHYRYHDDALDRRCIWIEPDQPDDLRQRGWGDLRDGDR